MNTFLELIHSRHSFRGEYQAVPVKREDLIKIMQAGIDAPSGCNKQTTSFIAIDDPHFTSDQLADLHLGQEVTVTADFGGEQQIDYPGRITWIASESEFTPKTIQTRNARANLVYAAKIAVENDGRLKIGLYGEVKR